MKSKRVAKLEHKLAENIRATEHVVRQEVSKDLNFLRRLLNEVNLMKVKVINYSLSFRTRTLTNNSYFKARLRRCGVKAAI